MTSDPAWAAPLGRDTGFGYLDSAIDAPRHAHPQLVLNTAESSMLRVLRDELKHAEAFTFSVAFVTPRAIALLKQEFKDFGGRGTIVTSDYLGFNSPQAFAELLGLASMGIDARLHPAPGYHPKGYVFERSDHVTAILGSSNLTETAIAANHEWNIKVSAAHASDLARQLASLIDAQVRDSAPLTEEWVDAYSDVYVTQRALAARGGPRVPIEAEEASALERHLERKLAPNQMQEEALAAISEVREAGATRAVVISATGTGKTILSAFDVHAAQPERMLFVVHREQILDRAIDEFRRVLDAPIDQFGKLSGSEKHFDRKYTFATVQTLSRPGVLEKFDARAFDYVLIDEVHRAGAQTYARVVEHFAPKFLLGMTATPERSDGFNIYELFDFNVPYEIRLGRALENDMLCPFHYYGVTDAEFEDGSTTSDASALDQLVGRVRVDHILKSLSTYGQAGVRPRGLIFCSRKDEAHALSRELNRSSLRGRALRTVALTGDDSVERRNAVIAELEAGAIDYVLTVDIFNEGVDIPSVNQVVMLRQTQSAIVFVQQLGRGLRKHPGKEYVVVIDFIGNYANNYLIPIALFGDESLNKESLRKNLAEAEESGVLPGLSSVRFDRIAQQRVLDSISKTSLDSIVNIKRALDTLRNRLGKVPTLHDFWRFESVDPVLLATKRGNYPALVEGLLKVESGLTEAESQYLTMLSNEVFAAKRPQELTMLQMLLDRDSASIDQLVEAMGDDSESSSRAAIATAIRSFTLEFQTQGERTKYVRRIVTVDGGWVSLADQFRTAYRDSGAFRSAVDDLVRTGLELVADRYDTSRPFTPGRQYSRKDACRLLNWSNNVSSTIYGYKVDYDSGNCPIFVTYHKSDEISASTAYEDELVDRTTMRWYTRSKRTLESKEVAAIVANEVDIHVFAKKDDAEGSDFYYLGRAVAAEAEQTTMPDDHGNELSVVRMVLNFDEPIDIAVYDYFHPVVMD